MHESQITRVKYVWFAGKSVANIVKFNDPAIPFVISFSSPTHVSFLIRSGCRRKSRFDVRPEDMEVDAKPPIGSR